MSSCLRRLGFECGGAEFLRAVGSKLKPSLRAILRHVTEVMVSVGALIQLKQYGAALINRLAAMLAPHTVGCVSVVTHGFRSFAIGWRSCAVEQSRGRWWTALCHTSWLRRMPWSLARLGVRPCPRQTIGGRSLLRLALFDGDQLPASAARELLRFRDSDARVLSGDRPALMLAGFVVLKRDNKSASAGHGLRSVWCGLPTVPILSITLHSVKRSRRTVAILAAGLLTACATAPPETVIGSAKPVEIRVPVVQPCLDPASIETMPPTAMPSRTENVEALAAGAYADATRYRELARRQQEQLKACASVNPQGVKP